MLRKWFGGERTESALNGVWQEEAIVDALKRQFETVERLGEDDGFVIYGVHDRGLAFVVALVTVGRGEVVEIGFLARFVGFAAGHAVVERINRNLHISVAGIEEEGDIYLLAAFATEGPFDTGVFSLKLDAWRRDLMVVMHALSGDTSMAAAFPAARSEVALRFATNAARSQDSGADLLQQYFGDRPAKHECGDCDGRGKRGLIARSCDACDGSGFVLKRRDRR